MARKMPRFEPKTAYTVLTATPASSAMASGITFFQEQSLGCLYNQATGNLGLSLA